MDADAFKRLFLPLHPKLYRIAYVLLEDKADAEDLLQDAYCKLWNKREELADILNPEAFCVTLVKNLCLDLLRSPQKRRQQEEIEQADRFEIAPSPEKELEIQDKIRWVRRLINELPANQKQVIKLHGINECSLDEIEQITGLTAVNIRVLLSRARKSIREKFEKIYAYERETAK